MAEVRINSTFQAVIKDSKEIRNIMLLESEGESDISQAQELISNLSASGAIRPFTLQLHSSEDFKFFEDTDKPEVQLWFRDAHNGLKDKSEVPVEELFKGEPCEVKGSWESVNLGRLGNRLVLVLKMTEEDFEGKRVGKASTIRELIDLAKTGIQEGLRSSEVIRDLFFHGEGQASQNAFRRHFGRG